MATITIDLVGKVGHPAGVRSTEPRRLVARLHVDLRRQASALCPR
ncbi:putative leader peptide [Thermomonospora catenispora]